ncbi:Conserved hypothetical, protein [Geosmithia morbida]|uniref:Conserved hypothetical, protein n=1 Tax=Geosmithia morbida TaxID=1094350 RepID=A0A9P4YSF6_9HYPO|nr:Conserved hypothetical, protein [Geosmithia morbida]KAF4120806.1 Conserved hypothetical, protein [Geosmithia morbida]
MGDTASTVGTLIVPAIVGLVVFLTLTYILLPAWRRYSSRYSQYLPINSFSEHTSSFRDRLTTRLLSIANRREEQAFAARGLSNVNIDHSDEQIDDGEELGDVDGQMRLASHGQSGDGTTADDQYTNTRRLSRE